MCCNKCVWYHDLQQVMSAVNFYTLYCKTKGTLSNNKYLDWLMSMETNYINILYYSLLNICVIHK